MSHLSLVPTLPAQECRCDRPSGRYWLQGEWHCTATDHTVRSYPYLGWHHYAGHRIIDPALTNQLEEIAA